MRIIQAELGNLHPLPRQERVYSTNEIEALMERLRIHGQVDPLVIKASSGHVVGGEAWIIAMRGMGWERCDVVEIGLDDSSAHGLACLMDREIQAARPGESALERVFPAMAGSEAPPNARQDEDQAIKILQRLDSDIGLPPEAAS